MQRNELIGVGAHVASKDDGFQQWAVPEKVEENAGRPFPGSIGDIDGEVKGGEKRGVEPESVKTVNIEGP